MAGLHVLLIVPPSPIWKPLHSCLGLDATTFRGVETILDTIVSARAGTWAWTSVWHSSIFLSSKQTSIVGISCRGYRHRRHLAGLVLDAAVIVGDHLDLGRMSNCLWHGPRVPLPITASNISDQLLVTQHDVASPWSRSEPTRIQPSSRAMLVTLFSTKQA